MSVQLCEIFFSLLAARFGLRQLQIFFEGLDGFGILFLTLINAAKIVVGVEAAIRIVETSFEVIRGLGVISLFIPQHAAQVIGAGMAGSLLDAFLQGRQYRVGFLLPI